MNRKERETSGTQTRRLNWNYSQIFARDWQEAGGWRTGTRANTWNEMHNNNRIRGGGGGEGGGQEQDRIVLWVSLSLSELKDDKRQT